MTEADPVATSLEQSIISWSENFKDLNDGGDIKRWQMLAANELAPVALFGQDLGEGVSMSGIFNLGEESRLSFPAFIDDDPVQSPEPTPEGVKVKFNGKKRQGMVVVTDASVKTVELNPRGIVPLDVPLDGVAHFQQVDMKFSTLSMTSAGGTYELLFTENGEPGRSLFRVALTPVDAGFSETLSNLIRAR